MTGGRQGTCFESGQSPGTMTDERESPYKKGFGGF